MLLNMRYDFDLGSSWTSTWLSCSSMGKICLLLFWLRLSASEDYTNLSDFDYWSAVVRYSYLDPRNLSEVNIETMGRYGLLSSLRSEEGEVVHVEDREGLNHGCSPYINNLPPPLSSQRWVALVERGFCKFQQKVHQAYLHNASAVVVYNHSPEDDLITMLHDNDTDLVTVFIGHVEGVTIARLVDSGVRVVMNISVERNITGKFHVQSPSSHLTNTAVLLTFIGLLIIGLIMVVVYAVRHAQHAHARHQAMNVTVTDGHQASTQLLPIYTPNGTEELTIQTTRS